MATGFAVTGVGDERRSSARRRRGLGGPHCGPPVDTCCRASAGYAIMQLASGLSVTLVRRRHVDLGRMASAICCCAL
ncbi:putative leader peptide [Streptomyces sp. NPDC004082]|uniref:putative leader peptide n=1 Tax=unclassified Streptomyces TaxID=2593676 RepID=UPI0033A0C29A